MNSLLHESVESICSAKGPNTDMELSRTIPPSCKTSILPLLASVDATLNVEVIAVRCSFTDISFAKACVVVPDVIIISAGALASNTEAACYTK